MGSHGRLLASAPTHGLDPLAKQAAAATLSRNVPAGRGTAEPFGSDWTFFPMGDAALGLARDDGRFPVATHEQPLLAGLLAQGALAFERARLAGEMAEVASLRERDHLRGALLSSVGHDLRTPLTTILAAAAELKARGAGDLAAAIENEGHRLDRYIADLLDMVRIEAGAIRLAIEPVDLLDVAAAAAREVAGALPPERLRIDVPPDLPLVRADARLLHHCLINLLANAAQHGGPGAVDIHAATGPDGVTLAVSDRGLGLPPGTERRIWEQFVRLEGSDRKGGTGLGLAIVSGFARAMGLGVEARNRADGQGASFQLRFPPALLVTIAAEEAA